MWLTAVCSPLHPCLLIPAERNEVTRILAGAASDSNCSVKVVSGISAEGSAEAIDHAVGAKEAGADGRT